MKFLISVAVALLTSSVALANDGGIAGLRVDQIKMRETALKNGEEVLVRKIVKPRFTISFEGGEAANLQKILPSELSVITAMYPDIAKVFHESFKTLAIYSETSKQASSKMITISCSDATADWSAEKPKITKTGKSSCVITIEGFGPDEGSPAEYGIIEKFEPEMCRK